MSMLIILIILIIGCQCYIIIGCQMLIIINLVRQIINNNQ